ncbi:hypothetical protein [Streptomyces sp. NPDC056628]
MSCTQHGQRVTGAALAGMDRSGCPECPGD